MEHHSHIAAFYGQLRFKVEGYEMKERCRVNYEIYLHKSGWLKWLMD